MRWFFGLLRPCLARPIAVVAKEPIGKIRPLLEARPRHSAEPLRDLQVAPRQIAATETTQCVREPSPCLDEIYGTL